MQQRQRQAKGFAYQNFDYRADLPQSWFYSNVFYVEGLMAVASPKLELTPIGVIRTKMKLKFDAPPQPDQDSAEQSVIELNPKHDFEQALKDLAGFDKIWLLWWFHKNQTWKPMVMPPRGESKRRGVFATRSPHRPNPIGITCVSLLKVSGRKLYVGSNDLLDGTPILDIKPYLAYADAFPDAKLGWIGEIEAQDHAAAEFTVEVLEPAKSQLAWLLSDYKLDLAERAFKLLERDPSAHRTRRISRLKDGSFRMGCGAWRLYFSLKGKRVSIERIAPGYPQRVLMSDQYNKVPFREAQIEFNRKWEAP